MGKNIGDQEPVGIREFFFRFYWKLQKIIVPKLQSAQKQYAGIIKSYVSPDTKWLDLGCGHQILPDWLAEEEKRFVSNCKMIVGVDADLSALKKHKNISLKVNGILIDCRLKADFLVW